jgi:hypothetical protein
VEFRLIYKGPLPAERLDGAGDSKKAEEKQIIRKCFHKQLRELWKQHPDLDRIAKATLSVREGGLARELRVISPDVKPYLEQIADCHKACAGNRFVPLVTEESGFTCSLDILFLRRDDPRGFVVHGGDIDNRLKVLFDALRMPKEVKELGGLSIDADEDPFFCVLQDDKYITNISVTTDRLILPQEEGEKAHDVLAIVHVTLTNPSALFVGYQIA